MAARPSSVLGAMLLLAALVAALLAPQASAQPAMTWEQILAAGDNSASSASAAVAPARSSNSKAGKGNKATVPAVSLALADFWATMTWNDAAGEWECATPPPRPGSVGSATCGVFPGVNGPNEMIAIVVTCPDGTQAIAPSCFHPFIGDSPSKVYGWFARAGKVACGFTVPPQQPEPFVVGASAYCMTVALVAAPAKKGGGHSGR